MMIEVIGVHPVEMPEEPCHLLEIRLTGEGRVDLGAITQPASELPEAEWQVAYDPYLLAAEGTSGSELDDARIRVHGSARAAFFYHYLDPTGPLQTPVGLVRLPSPTALPARLRFIQYEPPG